MDYAIGCDVGGSFVKMGLVERDGTLKTRHTTPLPRFDTPEQLAVWLTDTLMEFYKKNAPDGAVLHGVGIGIPGPVRFPDGTLFDPPNLPFEGEIPFGDLLRSTFPHPLFIDNDATVQTLGEARVGKGKGAQNFIYMALGTGIGGGIVMNGQLYRGTLGMAGEIGHLTIDYRGRKCLCGSRGCLETYASINGIANTLKEIDRPLPEEIRESLENGQWSRLPGILKERIDRGETEWQEVWDIFADALGAGMGTLINLFNPEKIVISGGLSHLSALCQPRAMKTSRRYAFTRPAVACEIVVSDLKDTAGIIGAAFMAFESGQT
ncbi:MAG: ROK family protein [Deltaproteobacteria bacterium]|nr:ROK family protein [Deltaproteobacteria bacterium]